VLTYVLLQFSFGLAYQEADTGNVTRYCDLDGNTLFILPPEHDGGEVVDADPPRLDWMV
jgi:hypothetical protein